MEVPDKIYISSNIENRTWLFGKADTTSVEYIRKDTLLELIDEYKNYLSRPFWKLLKTRIETL